MATVYDAVIALAEHCDGAVSRDKQGFKPLHTDMGRYLSIIPRDQWGEDTVRFIYKHVLPTYRKQLLKYGINLDEIEVPPKPTRGGLPSSVAELNVPLRNKYNAIRDEKAKKIWLDGNMIAIAFNYDQRLVDAVKQIRGRKFDGDLKIWRVPLFSKNEVVAFAETWNFPIPQSVMDAVAPAPPQRISENRIEICKDHIKLFFRYDLDIYESVLEIPGRKFHKEPPPKYWTIPMREESLVALQGVMLEYSVFEHDLGKIAPLVDVFEAHGEKQQELSSTISGELVPDHIKHALSKLNGTMRGYQQVAVAFGHQNKRVLISDDMGIGKTIEAIGIFGTLPGALPALVVCPASVKLNWAIEIKSWLPQLSVSIAHQNKKPLPVTLKDGSEFKVPTNDFSADVFIINYDLLKKHYTAIIGRFNTIVFDESQALKNTKAQRTKLAKEIAEEPQIISILELTGTPVMNRPSELISQLDILGRLDEFGGFWEVARGYCGFHKTRYGWQFANADELNHHKLEDFHEMLRRKGVYIRRTKEQVLTELPPKQRTTLPIEMSPKGAKEYQEAVAAFISWLQENARLDEEFKLSLVGMKEADKKIATAAYRKEKAKKALLAEHLVKIENLKQLAVRAKMETLKTWLAEFLETGEQLVVFGDHREFIDELSATFKAPSITGSTKVEDRQRYIDDFQAHKIPMIICNIKAGGVGITLTAASNVVFFELGWNSAVMDQAEDRCYRYGQLSAVNCWYLLAQGTIEIKLAAMIEQKRSMANAIIDGKADANTAGMIGDLTNFLLMQAAEKDKRIAKFMEELEEGLF